MLDCETTRRRFDCLTVEQRREDQELASHLESCAECLHYRDQLQQFDRQVSQRLADVPIPEGLTARLAQSFIEQGLVIEQGLSTDPIGPHSAHNLNSHSAQPKRRPTSRNRAVQWMSGAVAAVLVATLSIILWQASSDPEALSYQTAKSLLLDKFLEIQDGEWKDLDDFDESFDSSEPSLSGWMSLHECGYNLDGDSQHDVIVSEFRYQKWSGILIAFPVTEFSGIPKLPNLDSGRPVIEWRSPDGQLAYLCLVRQGSAEELRDAIMGPMT